MGETGVSCSKGSPRAHADDNEGSALEILKCLTETAQNFKFVLSASASVLKTLCQGSDEVAARLKVAVAAANSKFIDRCDPHLFIIKLQAFLNPSVARNTENFFPENCSCCFKSKSVRE